MPGATAHGYPYTADTDTMGTWPTTSQNAANKLEAVLHAAWVAPALAGAWVIHSAATPVGYRNRAGETVLKGLVKDGAPGVIFVLPAGYRPTQNSHFLAHSNTGVALLRVDTAGNVSLISYAAGGSNAYVALDGIRFEHV